MSNNFFSRDDESFSDIPDEVSGGRSEIPAAFLNQQRQSRPQPQQQYSAPQAQEPVYEQTYETTEETELEDEDFSSILTNARYRLQQAHLYEMLIEHDLFAGVEVDDKIIRYVSRQIKNFANDQLQIMLGMKQDTSKQQVQQNLPFSEAEIIALKELAYVASKGATGQKPQSTPTIPPKTQTLNKLNVKQPQAKAAPAPIQKPAPQPVAKTPAPALPKKAAAPVQRPTKENSNVDKILSQSGLKKEDLELDYKPLDRHPSEMTEQERAEWRKQNGLNYKGQVKPQNAIPMPSAEQQEMIYTQRLIEQANPLTQAVLNTVINKR